MASEKAEKLREELKKLQEQKQKKRAELEEIAVKFLAKSREYGDVITADNMAKSKEEKAKDTIDKGKVKVNKGKK